MPVLSKADDIVARQGAKGAMELNMTYDARVQLFNVFFLALSFSCLQ